MNYKGGKPKCKICKKELGYRPKTFLCREHWYRTLIGESALHWKGGRKNNNGYIMIYNPAHPKHDQQGYVREHRLVMEKYLGRYLEKSEIIHHLNHKRDDNKLENLVIMNKKDHDELHLVTGVKTRFKKGQIPWNKGGKRNV